MLCWWNQRVKIIFYYHTIRHQKSVIFSLMYRCLKINHAFSLMLMLEFLFEKRKARISLKYYFSFKLKKIPLLTVVAMSNHHKVTFCPFTIFIPIYINTKQMSSAGLSRYCLFLTQAGSSKRKVVRDFEKKKQENILQ